MDNEILVFRALNRAGSHRSWGCCSDIVTQGFSIHALWRCKRVHKRAWSEEGQKADPKEENSGKSIGPLIAVHVFCAQTPLLDPGHENLLAKEPACENDRVLSNLKFSNTQKTLTPLVRDSQHTLSSAAAVSQLKDLLIFCTVVMIFITFSHVATI